jgi:hypothetical protein
MTGATGFDQLVEGHQAQSPHGRGGRRIHGGDETQFGGLRRGSNKLLGELALRHDRALGAAILQDVGMVGGGVGDVSRHRDRAGRHDGEIGDRPRRPVFRHDRDPIAWRDAGGDQAAGERADPRRGVAPAQRPPRAAALGPQERTVAEGVDLVEEHRREVWPAREAIGVGRRGVIRGHGRAERSVCRCLKSFPTV